MSSAQCGDTVLVNGDRKRKHARETKTKEEKEGKRGK